MKAPAILILLETIATGRLGSETVLAKLSELPFVETEACRRCTISPWRMQVATQKLRTISASIAQVAEIVGYESEAAFSRAFKKAFGVAQPCGDVEQLGHGHAKEQAVQARYTLRACPGWHNRELQSGKSLLLLMRANRNRFCSDRDFARLGPMPLKRPLCSVTSRAFE
jgi:AraC-like DNA-binding protein